MAHTGNKRRGRSPTPSDLCATDSQLEHRSDRKFSDRGYRVLRRRSKQPPLSGMTELTHPIQSLNGASRSTRLKIAATPAVVVADRDVCATDGTRLVKCLAAVLNGVELGAGLALSLARSSQKKRRAYPYRGCRQQVQNESRHVPSSKSSGTDP